MKLFYTMLIFFLSTNFLILGSNFSDKNYPACKKNKPSRPPFPVGHIPNFSNHNSSALSVFSASSNIPSQEEKADKSNEEQKTFREKKVTFSCAPLPVCYQFLPINNSKSCLKQNINLLSLVSLNQQNLREIIFNKRKKSKDVSFLTHKKSNPCSDCASGYNSLKCAFLCRHYLHN